MVVRALIQRGLLALAALGLVFGVGELVLRLRAAASAGPPREVRIHDFAYIDEDEVPRFQPYALGWHRGYGDAEENLVRLNSLGIPGPEPLGEPGQRIAFVGDSITFNGGIPWEQSFLGLAAGQLRDAGLANSEILNFGFSDANLAHYEKKLEFEVLPLEPDLVYVGVYLNDAIGIEGSSVPILADDLPRRVPHSASPSLMLRWLDRRLEFALAPDPRAPIVRDGVQGPGRLAWVPRFEEKRYLDEPLELRQLIADARNDWGSAWTDEYANALSASLQRMRSLTEPRGIPLVVVSFPVSPQVEVDLAPVALWLPQRRTDEITRRLGIPLLDPLPGLRQASRESGVPLYRDQCHFSLEGNRVVAELIAQDAIRRLQPF